MLRTVVVLFLSFGLVGRFFLVSYCINFEVPKQASGKFCKGLKKTKKNNMCDGRVGRQVMAVKGEPVVIEDDATLTKHDPQSKENNFSYPSEYEGHLEGVLVRGADIMQRTEELAEIIAADYRCKHPMIICVLKGASMFYNNLLMALSRQKLGYAMEFIRAKSYGMNDTTSGNVEISGIDLKWVKDRDIILVEDVIDTGTTMSQVIPVLKEAGCKSIEVASLLDKRIEPGRRRMGMAKYTGFSIPDHFVVGHGLDFAELYRDCFDIWVVSEAGKKAKGQISTL